MLSWLISINTKVAIGFLLLFVCDQSQMMSNNQLYKNTYGVNGEYAPVALPGFTKNLPSCSYAQCVCV
jgi:hypothetical protein